MTIEWRQLSQGLRMRTFLWTYNTTLKIVNIVRGIQEIVYELSTLKLSQNIQCFIYFNKYGMYI